MNQTRRDDGTDHILKKMFILPDPHVHRMNHHRCHRPRSRDPFRPCQTRLVPRAPRLQHKMSWGTGNRGVQVREMLADLIDRNFDPFCVDWTRSAGPDRWIFSQNVMEGIREDRHPEFRVDELHDLGNREWASLFVIRNDLLSKLLQFGIIEESRSAEEGGQFHLIAELFRLFSDRALVNIEKGSDDRIWARILAFLPQDAACMGVLLWNRGT